MAVPIFTVLNRESGPVVRAVRAFLRIRYEIDVQN